MPETSIMEYQEAFQAFQDKDYLRAAELLEQAARESGYRSDIINHVYTLSLHHARKRDRLVEVAFEIANLFVDDEPALALDYYQRAIFAGLDRARARQIGEVLERWSAEASSHTRLESPFIRRVAHVVGRVAEGHALSQYLKLLIQGLRDHGIESVVFTTEWSAAWFMNPPGAAESQSLDLGADIRIGSTEGDFVQRAERIAKAIGDAGVDVALYHASLSEQITARVAAFGPAPIQVNVNHGIEMDADLFDGFVHLFQNAQIQTRFPSRPSQWIPPVSDIEERLAASEPVSRSMLGLNPDVSVSVTFGDVSGSAWESYLRVVSQILSRFPKHFHLMAGTGSIRAIRGFLHAEGVLPRVRFLGQQGDLSSLLEVADVYLAPFPGSDARIVLDAMGAGKPVVVRAYGPDSPDNSAAELVGISELIAESDVQYVRIADRLIRSVEERRTVSQRVKDRFRAEFRPARMGRRYLEFLNQLGACRSASR